MRLQLRSRFFRPGSVCKTLMPDILPFGRPRAKSFKLNCISTSPVPIVCRREAATLPPEFESSFRSANVVPTWDSRRAGDRTRRGGLSDAIPLAAHLVPPRPINDSKARVFDRPIMRMVVGVVLERHD